MLGTAGFLLGAWCLSLPPLPTPHVPPPAPRPGSPREALTLKLTSLSKRKGGETNPQLFPTEFSRSERQPSHCFSYCSSQLTAQSQSKVREKPPLTYATPLSCKSNSNFPAWGREGDRKVSWKGEGQWLSRRPKLLCHRGNHTRNRVMPKETASVCLSRL